MIKTILITGGAGFIGSHTVDLLIRNNYKVIVLDSLNNKTHNATWPDYINPEATYIKGNVLDRTLLTSILAKVDSIIHLAAEMDLNPEFQKFIDVNVGSTALLYELILLHKFPIKKIIIASTQFVYGEGQWSCKNHGIFSAINRSIDQIKIKNWDIVCPKCFIKADYIKNLETYQNPPNHYALSKYFQETLSLNLGKLYNIPTTALRYSIVHGPRQSLKNTYSGALRTFLLNLLQDKPLATFEDNLNKRDFVSVFDIAKANLLALKNTNANFEIFNVGGIKEYTTYDLAKLISIKLNKKLHFSSNIEYRPGDIRNAISDTTKIENILGWKPDFTEQDTLDLYIDWVKSQDIDFYNFNKTQIHIRKIGIVKSIK